MKSFFFPSILAVTLMASFTLGSAPSPDRATDIGSGISSIIRELGLSSDKVGISVRSILTGDEVTALNNERFYNPASNIKILTSYCALKNLGANYHWKTELYSDSVPAEGEIRGNLRIKGYGDPYMVSESLWMLAKELLNRGVRSINGNIVLDSTAFGPVKGKLSFSKDSDRSFTASPTALALNFEAVTIYVYPDSVGKPPRVVIDPDVEYFELENSATTVASRHKENPKLTAIPINGKTRIKVYGKWSYASKRVHYRKVYHPEIYFGYAFKKFFVSLGGTVSGSIREGVVPEKAHHLFSFDSKPLSQVVFGMNKFSSNFIADQILLTMGGTMDGLPATEEKGLKCLNDCFASLGLTSGKAYINSASGLSRETRLTASQLTSILYKAYRDFRIAPELVASFGLYGEDGTVRKRSLPEDTAGLIRVKTGSLDDVDALSGFIRSKSDSLYSFSIIANGFSESKKPLYRELQDRVVSFIYNEL